jgi:uncharacterized protein YfaA (DUF2138 family)
MVIVLFQSLQLRVVLDFAPILVEMLAQDSHCSALTYKNRIELQTHISINAEDQQQSKEHAKKLTYGQSEVGEMYGEVSRTEITLSTPFPSSHVLI